MAYAHVFGTRIEDKFRIQFVNGIVGEVHAHVVHVLGVWLLVLFCCKSGQSLIV